MTSGRRPKKEIMKIKKFVADLLLNRSSEISNSDGQPNISKIIRIVNDELGIKVDPHNMSKWVKRDDLTKYQHLSTPGQNERMRELDKKIRLAKDISEDEDLTAKERLTALSTYNQLFNTKSKYEEQLANERMKAMEITRPNYLLQIGHYENVKKKCPKCGHEWYDIEDKKEENKNKWNLKADKGQSTFDEFEGKDAE